MNMVISPKSAFTNEIAEALMNICIIVRDKIEAVNEEENSKVVNAEEVAEEKKDNIVEINVKPDDVINMEDRKICPVQVIPAKEEPVVIDVTGKKEKVNMSDEGVAHISSHLMAMGANLKDARRVSTGLIEADIVQNDGNIITITIDDDNRIYGLPYHIFFIGKISSDFPYEYQSMPIMLTEETINGIINHNYNFEKRYYVPEKYLILNRLIDLTSLKENNKNKRKKMLEKLAKVFTAFNDDIVRAANGDEYRFTVVKYKSYKDFTIVSSKKNRISNIGNRNLNATKEIWIKSNNNGNVDLFTK